MSFDWQADEIEENRDPGPSKPRHGLLLMLLAAIFIGGLALWAVRMIGRRAHRVTEAIAAEVRAGDDLARRAAAAQDEELFRDLLSGRDPAWTQVQLQRFDQNLLFGQAARPLGLRPAPSSSIVVSLTLSPNLNEATLLLRNRYTVTTTAGMSRTVALEQPLVYRKGSRSWLLSPPEEAFWGAWRTVRAPRLVVAYPARDEALARKLAADLSQALGPFCEQLRLDCEGERRYRLYLTADPESLLLLDQGLLETDARLQLNMPAPSLVGRPAGPAAGAAYEALLRGYGSHLLHAVAAARLGYNCCDGAPYFQALIHRLLVESDVAVWPVSPADLLDSVDHPILYTRLEDFWWADRLRAEPPTPLEREQISFFVMFLEAVYDVSPGRQIRFLLESGSFWEWLRAISGYGPGEEQLLDTDYLDYLYQEAQAIFGARSIHVDGALHLLCRDPNRGFGLYRFDPGGEGWTLLARVDGQMPSLHSHSNRRALLIFDELNERPDQPPSRLWLDGGMVSLDSSLRPASELLPDPGGRYLPFWRIPPDGADAVEPLLLDLESCGSEGNCSTITLPGLPVWSPSGALLLAWDAQDGRLFYGERRRLGEDHWSPAGVRTPYVPIWLDEAHFSYVDEDAWGVQIRSPAGSSSETLVSIDDLLDSFTRDDDRNWWSIRSAAPVPSLPGVYLVVAVPRSAGINRQLFLVDTKPAGPPAVEPLVYLRASRSSRLLDGLSPSNSWLALNRFASIGRGNRFVLYDLRSGQRRLSTEQPFFIETRPLAWSPRGDRLARLGYKLLELITPTENGLERQFTFTGDRQCSSVVWTEEETAAP